MKYSVEIKFDRECGDFWVYINGEVEAFASTRGEAAKKADEILARIERQAREYSQRSMTQAQLEANCPDFCNAAIPFFDEVEKHMEVWDLAA